MNKLFKMNAIAAAMALTTSVADAGVFIKYENIKAGPVNDEWFVADSFSFGVEREMKESGEKGGTADINIGVGELQEVEIDKIQDASTFELARLSLTGRTLGTVEVCVTDSDTPVDCYLHIVMERAYVKSWNTSGDGDDRPIEEVAFYYNKIAFEYTDPGGGVMGWDNVKNKSWSDGSRLLSGSR